MGDYQPHKEDTVITVHKGKRGSGMVEEKLEKCNEKESTRKTLLATAPSDSAGRTNILACFTAEVCTVCWISPVFFAFHLHLVKSWNQHEADGDWLCL